MKTLSISVFLCSILVSKNLFGQALAGTAGLHYILKKEKFNSDFRLLYDGVPTELCDPIYETSWLLKPIKQLFHPNGTSAALTANNGHLYVDVWSLNGGCITGGIGGDLPIRDHVIEIVDNRYLLKNPTFVLNLPLRAWSFGVNAIPFRFRPAINNPNISHNSVVTTQFSLALSFGPTFGHGSITTRGITNWTFTPSVFLGPSSTGTTTALPTAQANLAGSQNNFAMSYGISGIFARNNVGILVALGWDSAISKNAGSWPYQCKPWIGIGVSTGILK